MAEAPLKIEIVPARLRVDNRGPHQITVTLTNLTSQSQSYKLKVKDNNMGWLSDLEQAQGFLLRHGEKILQSTLAWPEGAPSGFYRFYLEVIPENGARVQAHLEIEAGPPDEQCTPVGQGQVSLGVRPVIDSQLSESWSWQVLVLNTSPLQRGFTLRALELPSHWLNPAVANLNLGVNQQEELFIKVQPDSQITEDKTLKLEVVADRDQHIFKEKWLRLETTYSHSIPELPLEPAEAALLAPILFRLLADSQLEPPYEYRELLVTAGRQEELELILFNTSSGEIRIEFSKEGELRDCLSLIPLTQNIGSKKSEKVVLRISPEATTQAGYYAHQVKIIRSTYARPLAVLDLKLEVKEALSINENSLLKKPGGNTQGYALLIETNCTELKLHPYQEAKVEVIVKSQITNFETIDFYLEGAGIDERWWSTTQELNGLMVRRFGSLPLELSIKPPAELDVARAGNYQLNFQANAKQSRGRSKPAQLILQVTRVGDFLVQPEQPERIAPGRIIYPLRIHNLTNAVLQLNFKASDEQNLLQYEFDEPSPAVEPGSRDKLVHLTVTVPKLEATGRQVEFNLVAEGIYQLFGGVTEEARPRVERLIFVQPEMEVQGDYSVEPIQTEITGLEKGIFQFILHNRASSPLSLRFCLIGASLVNHSLKGDTDPYTLVLQPGETQTLNRRIQPRVTEVQGATFELDWEVVGTYLLEGDTTRPAQKRSGSLHFHQEALRYELEALQTEAEGLEKASFQLKVANKSHARLELYPHIATPDPTMQYQFKPEKLELDAGQAGFITLMATPVLWAANGRKVNFNVRVEGHFLLTSGLRPVAPSTRLEFTFRQPVPPQLELNAEPEMQQISAAEPVRYTLKLRNPGISPVEVVLKAEAPVSPARMAVRLIPVGLSLEANEERKVLMEVQPHTFPYPDNQWLNQVAVTAEPKNNLYRPAQVIIRLAQFQPGLTSPEPLPPSGRGFNWWLLAGGLVLIITSLWFLSVAELALLLVGSGLLLILLAWFGSEGWGRRSPVQVTFVYQPVTAPGREQLILALMGKIWSNLLYINLVRRTLLLIT